MKHKLYIFFIAVLFLFNFSIALAHQPELIYLQKTESIQISNPEISRAFYDELKGKPRDYFIDSANDFILYINLLVPASENPKGKYSANIYLINGEKKDLIFSTDVLSTDWVEYYEEFGRDYYYKGPEYEKQVMAGKYKIEVFSADNLGKYVLAVGKTESFDIKSLLNVYWQIPTLKLTFFKTSVLQFFLTPFGIGGVAAIGGLIILFFLINFLIGAIKTTIKHNQAKTLLLTSAGMDMREEIVKLLQKPAYDITVAFIITASNPEENKDYLQKDLVVMREMGFNVEEMDIEGKNEGQVMEMLKLKDIIFVEGGNTFYLLNAMRRCNFEKVIRKLLKDGKVYIGASAGSIVAGKTIMTSAWRSEAKGINRNTIGLRNLKGLNLVPYDIFVHYNPQYDEIIKKKMPSSRKRAKKLRIISDGQAILIQGKEEALIGRGEKIIV